MPADTVKHTPAEWCYKICYGPEGEMNYAFVYDHMGDLVGNLKFHHAKAVVEAMNRRAPDPVREKLVEALKAAEQQLDYGQVDAAHQIILRALASLQTGEEG